MPTGNGVLSEDDLGLLRAWIRGGAPETNIVKGSEQYTDCSLEGTLAPNKIQPLPAPAADEVVEALVDAGVQAILNFAPIKLESRPDVKIRNVDLAVDLGVLSFFVTGKK